MNPIRLTIIAEKFERLHFSAGARVDFDQPRHPEHTYCGTVACHGGWAGVVLGTKKPESAYLFFEEGADALARYLNPLWADHEDLENWAMNNPKLWGNNWGQVMFDSNGYRAFGKNKNCTLLDIANHYREVAKRIKEVNQ